MRRLRFPHPLTLLTAVVLAAAALSYVLPAGEYDRRDDPETGRSIVVPGSYQEVEANRIGIFDAIVAIPRGMAGRADVVFLIFLIGGAFAVFDATGALRRGIAWLVERLEGREILAIPVVSLAFAAGGVTENLQEEIIPLVPALMLLTKRLGYSPMVGVAVSAGSAFVGSAFSPINPFQVLTAQEVADVAPLSGSGFRLVFLAVALGLWIWWTMRYAARTRVEAETVEAAESEAAPGWRDLTIFGIVAATFGVLVWGLLSLGWDFDHMSALFFVMGVVVGIVGRLGITGTAEAYAQGFKSMGYAALLIGFANAIYVVMDDARIIDTIVRGLFIPLAELPLALSAIGMSAAQGVLHFAVPSVSGQAVLTLPVLVPLSDLLGLSRQITILAYQYGAGLCDLITPTNGALMAILAASGVRYEAWLRFVVPRYLMLMALGAVALVIAIAIGYS
ncbi:YfcC family protein [Candidatus Palauibacter sp.]|uniref:YfcC family protein n=1 Tax=Candidatus Palauibacter sp. TaxID=3101350 RepID=UPI003B5182B9